MTSRNYAMSFRCQGRSHTMIYSRRDFKVAHAEQFPEMMALTLAVGVWDNFTVAKGMDVYAWTSRPVPIARWAVRSVVKVLEKDGDLFAYDYSFRSLYHTRWESRHFGHFTINGAAVWILPGPGQLFLGHNEEASFGPVKVCDVDLRPFEKYRMADGTEIRIRRKKADFGLLLHMKKLLDFLESCPEDTVEIRHHYEGGEA